MSSSIDKILTGVLTLTAVCVGGFYVRSQLIGQSSPSDTTSLKSSQWTEVVESATPIFGDPEAPNVVVVFTDLQCPACRGFHMRTLEKVFLRDPQTVRVLLQHFPLEYHKYALAAANATACVSGEAELRRWLHSVFSQQDSLGSRSFESFAVDAELPDARSIAECSVRKSAATAVENGVRLAEALRARGTPAVLVNGQMFSTPPTLEKLDSLFSRNHGGP